MAASARGASTRVTSDDDDRGVAQLLAGHDVHLDDSRAHLRKRAEHVQWTAKLNIRGGAVAAARACLVSVVCKRARTGQRIAPGCSANGKVDCQQGC